MLKDREKIRTQYKDERCDDEKLCSKYVHHRGKCLFKDMKSGRCMILDDDESAGLNPAGGIL